MKFDKKERSRPLPASASAGLLNGAVYRAVNPNTFSQGCSFNPFPCFGGSAITVHTPRLTIWFPSSITVVRLIPGREQSMSVAD